LVGKGDRGIDPFQALITQADLGDETVISSESSYQFQKFDGVSVIALLPELNDVPWADIESIGSAILEQMDAQKKPLFLIDLDALTYMRSAMVALVVKLWKSVKTRKGRMAVVNNDEMVREVLSIAGLDEIWTIVDTRAEGLKALGVSARKIRALEKSLRPGKESPKSEMWETGTAVLTLLTVAVASAGLYLLLVPQEFLQDRRIILGLLFGGSILGLLTGIAATALGFGIKRGIGIFGVLGALGIITAGVCNTLNHNDNLDKNEQKKPAGSVAANSRPAGEDEKTETSKANDEKSKVVIIKTGSSGSIKQAFPTITTSEKKTTKTKDED
jgi:anti-anti-sigma factor